MPNFKKNTSPAMKKSGFKMKGYSYPGTSPVKDGKVLPFMTSKRMPKDHPVTPPKNVRGDTLKGLTQFETDIRPITNIAGEGLRRMKKIYYDNPKKVITRVGGKVKKYFTER